MLNFQNQVVSYTLYLWNEVGDPHFSFFFFAFLTQVIHYLTAVKIEKKSLDWKIFAQAYLNTALGV